MAITPLAFLLARSIRRSERPDDSNSSSNSKEEQHIHKLAEAYMVGKWSIGGTKADVWNFGLTLYFMLFGIHIDEYYLNNVDKLLLKGEFTYPKREPPDSFLFSMITKCLNPKVSARPSVHELVQDFYVIK